MLFILLGKISYSDKFLITASDWILPAFLKRISSSFFFFFKIFIYLAVPGLDCSMQDLLLQHVRSGSLTRDWTQAPALGAQSLRHWTTREVPHLYFWQIFSLGQTCKLIDSSEFPPRAWKTLPCSSVSLKPASSLILVALGMVQFFLWAAFRVLSLSLALSYLMMIYLATVFFIILLLEV